MTARKDGKPRVYRYGLRSNEIYFTEEDLIDRVSKNDKMLLLTRGDVADAVTVLFDRIARAMAEGDEVEIPGFGIFMAVKVKRTWVPKFFSSRLLPGVTEHEKRAHLRKSPTLRGGAARELTSGRTGGRNGHER